jgi:hypothetical protein
LCADYLTRHPIRLGGVGNEVEIDETFLHAKLSEAVEFAISDVGFLEERSVEQISHSWFRFIDAELLTFYLKSNASSNLEPLYIRVYLEGLLGA